MWRMTNGELARHRNVRPSHNAHDIEKKIRIFLKRKSMLYGLLSVEVLLFPNVAIRDRLGPC